MGKITPKSQICPVLCLFRARVLIGEARWSIFVTDRILRAQVVGVFMQAESETSTPVLPASSRWWHRRNHLWIEMVRVAIAVFVAEVMVMFMLPVVAPDIEGLWEAVLDGAMLTLIAGPYLAWRIWHLYTMSPRMATRDVGQTRP